MAINFPRMSVFGTSFVSGLNLKNSSSRDCNLLSSAILVHCKMQRHYHITSTCQKTPDEGERVGEENEGKKRMEREARKRK